MMRRLVLLALLSASVCPLALRAQAPRDLVQQAVNIEIAADAADHSHWLYREDYKSPDKHVRQWVAQTAHGDIKRVYWQNGSPVALGQQHAQVDSFVNDEAAQAKQKKASNSDDDQSVQMMRILPTAFVWTEKSHTAERTVLHFVPDPNYSPSSYAARIFAAMMGDLTIDNASHRITGLTGTMQHDVLFGGGLFGRIERGGAFSLERQQVAPGQWQITATHVHVRGHVLFFKTISDQEDDLMSNYQLQGADITLRQAAELVFQQPAE